MGNMADDIDKSRLRHRLISDFLGELHEEAKEACCYEYGLPFYGGHEEKLIRVVEDFLKKLDS